MKRLSLRSTIILFNAIMTIRPYQSQDIQQITKLFHDTVHHVNIYDYSQEQLDVWAPEDIDLDSWHHRLSSQCCLIAMIENNIVGFGSIDPLGCLDMLYVHKDFQKQGIASKLCDELESFYSLSSVYTHASITAKAFFLNRGYKVIKEQMVERRGITLINYQMEKCFI